MGRLMSKKSNISLNRMTSLLFMIYIFTMTTANHTVYLIGAMVSFTMAVTGWMILSKRIYYNNYFTIVAFFILYHVYIICTDVSINPSASFDVVKTLTIAWAMNLITYNFILLERNPRNSLKLFVYGCFAGTVSLFIIGWKSILNGRFLFSGSLNFLGVRIGVNSNYTAFICSIALLITIYLWIKENKVKCIFISSVFIVSILLTGSRKALFLMIVGSMVLVYFMYPKKKMKNILLAIILSIIVYICINEIPILYEVIGSRVESALEFYKTGETNEASLSARNRFIEFGIYLFKSRPISGYGLDAFRYLNNGIYSHNNYIELLVSGGIIGTCIYYFGYIYILIKVAKESRRTRTEQTKQLLTTFIILVLIQMLLEYWMVSYNEKMFNITMILALGCMSISKITELKSIVDDK